MSREALLEEQRRTRNELAFAIGDICHGGAARTADIAELRGKLADIAAKLAETPATAPLS